MYNILITDGIDKEAILKLKELNFNIIEKFYELKELGNILKNIDVLIIRSETKIRKVTIDEAVKGNRLKLIVRAGVGLDNIDVEYARINGIEVMNTPEASTRSVAELTIGQIITLARFINTTNLTMREGEWDRKKYKGIEINGKVLGIIGFGRIGKTVADLAYALGMKIIYYDILGKIDGYCKYRYCSMEDLLSKSDFITLHIPYDENKGVIIGQSEIEKMKDGVYFINCARGGVVCEKDLLRGLTKGKIAGIAMDVYEQEPTLNLELIRHPMVSTTPHIGGSTTEALNRIGSEIVSIIKEYFSIDEDDIDVAL